MTMRECTGTIVYTHDARPSPVRLMRAPVIAVLSVLMVALAGCSPETSDDPFTQVGFDAYDGLKSTRVGDYFKAVNAGARVASINPPVIYVDFSNGMIQAYTSSTANSDVMKAIGQKFVDPAITWFKLGNDSIAQLSELKNYQLYNTVTDPKSYAKEIMAPIQRTLERIVSSTSESLLITDFEEYTPDRREQMLGYGKDHFKRWLMAGNKLTIFSNPYEEKTKDGRTVTKRLNFIVFSIGQGGPDGLLDRFRKAIEGIGMSVPFELTNGSYRVTNSYVKEGVGGLWYNTKAPDDAGRNVFEMENAAYVNGLAVYGVPFEFYPLELPWSYVDKTRHAEQGEGMQHFLRGLVLDASNNGSYGLVSVSVEAHDVTEDFEHFARCQEALKHVPKVVSDPDHGYKRFADDEADPIALGCYDSTGTIKAEWKYAPKERAEVKEAFTLAETLFQEKLKESPGAVELAIDFHKEFKPEALAGARLLRLDVVVKSTQDRSQDAALSAMKWESTTMKGRQNESLYYSIKETLQDPALAPERSHPVLYTYFILTPPEQ